MFTVWWIGIRFVPGGHSAFGPPINSFVHVLMYGYYAATAAGEPWSKLVRPIKKWLTVIQLCQFVLVFCNTLAAIHSVRAGHCHFPEWMGWVRYDGSCLPKQILSLYVGRFSLFVLLPSSFFFLFGSSEIIFRTLRRNENTIMVAVLVVKIVGHKITREKVRSLAESSPMEIQHNRFCGFCVLTVSLR